MKLPCVWTVLVVGTMAITTTASGQSYPHKPIRLLSGETGGSTDITARLITPGLSAALGQQVIVDNRVTGLSQEIAAKAPADGHTLLITGNSIWLLPYLRENVPFDVVRDFAPITAATSAPLVLVVNAALPVASAAELIALAKSKPGYLNYGSGPAATASHLTAELFKSMAGVDIVRVPYKSTGPAAIDLISGQVQVMFAPTATVVPHVKSGKLKALGVTSAQPSALVPGVPSVAAAVPGYESVQLIGILAPGRTPVAIIERLNQELVRILNQADIKDKFINLGSETIGSSRQQFAAMRDADMNRLGKVIRAAGIRIE